MQDDKLINVSGATPRKSGVYSIEFHEEGLYAHVKQSMPDGTAVYHSIKNSGPTSSANYENYSDSGATTYTALQGVETALALDANGPFEDKRFSPAWLTHDLYNTSTNKIDLSGIPIGTLVHVTYDFKLIPSSSNDYAKVYLKFGTFGGYKMYVSDGNMGSQNDIKHYSGTKTFFVINEELQQNGVELMVETGCDTQIVPSFLMIAIL
jgi:hypothetical protein